MATRPITIEATYRLSTPLFCSGADQDQAELRLPSFKGVLRYWWRALAWCRCGGNLQAIQHQEDALFGSAGGGQSRVAMRLIPTNTQPYPLNKGKVLTVSPTNQDVVGEGARYLGYGVMEAFASRNKGTQAGQLTRPCLRPPHTFTVELRARHLEERDRQSLKNALIAVGTLGGMGSKSRKGYGSLVLESLCIDGEEPWRNPRSMDDLGKAIATLSGSGKPSAPSGFPEFTAFSPKTRHVLLSSDEGEPMQLLDLVGREMLRYRSWGHHGQLFKEKIESEKNFKDDHDLMNHDLMKKRKHQRQGHTHPRRIAFGLPHNYGSKPHEQVGPHGSRLDRRASPLFIHVHQCSEKPVAVLSFLPARFLPSGQSKISVGGKAVAQKPEKELYNPVHAFLDRLLDRSQRKEPFTTAMKV